MTPPLRTMPNRSRRGDNEGHDAELRDCLAALHAVVDITGNSAIEGALVAASLYARSLLEASLDPLVTISPEGKITDLNEATEQVTGLAREALIGTDFCDYFTEPARARTAGRRRGGPDPARRRPSSRFPSGWSTSRPRSPLGGRRGRPSRQVSRRCWRTSTRSSDGP